VSAILNASEGDLSAAEGAREIASRAFANAGRLDVDGAFPAQEVAELHRLGSSVRSSQRAAAASVSAVWNSAECCE
jgi:hypothetical protein